MLKPILNDKEFALQHAEVDTLIKKLTTTRSGRGKLSQEIIEETRDRSTRLLPANNSRARRFFASALAEQIALHLDTDQAWDRSMVTVALSEHFFPLRKAREFNVDNLAMQVRDVIRGSYVGLIEAAFYPRSPLFSQPMVSWHAHCLVWCSDSKQLDRRIARANSRSRSAIGGLEPFHRRRLNHESLCKRAHYISKGQIRQYNVFIRRMPILDWDETDKDCPAEIFSQKTAIRPGNAVSMMRVMSGRTLHNLSISSGEGAEVLRLVIKNTIENITKEDNEKIANIIRSL